MDFGRVEGNGATLTGRRVTEWTQCHLPGMAACFSAFTAHNKGWKRHPCLLISARLLRGCITATGLGCAACPRCRNPNVRPFQRLVVLFFDLLFEWR